MDLSLWTMKVQTRIISLAEESREEGIVLIRNDSQYIFCLRRMQAVHDSLPEMSSVKQERERKVPASHKGLSEV